MKAPASIFYPLRMRVIRGMSNERYHEDGKAAYTEALTLLSPHQMGAIHHAMKRCESELYDIDMRAGAE
jgi:hypothetical protein